MPWASEDSLCLNTFQSLIAQERLERAAVAVMKRRKVTTGRRRAYLPSDDNSTRSDEGSESAAEGSVGKGGESDPTSQEPRGEGSNCASIVGSAENARSRPGSPDEWGASAAGSAAGAPGGHQEGQAPAGEASGENAASGGEGSVLPTGPMAASSAAPPKRATARHDRGASRAVLRRGSTASTLSQSLSTVALVPSIKEREAKLLLYMDFMLDVYRVEFWWWEIAEILRKLALAGVLSLIAPGSVMQVATGCIVSFGFVLMCVQKQDSRGQSRTPACFCRLVCGISSCMHGVCAAAT